MRRTIEHRCPGCDRLLGTSKSGPPVIGVPYFECGACNQFVSRPTCAEWDMLPPSAKFQYVGKTGAVWFLTGMIPGLLYGVGAGLIAGSYNPLFLFVGISVGAILGLSLWLGLVSRVVVRSRRRMMDPMYRAKLVEYGILSTGRSPAKA